MKSIILKGNAFLLLSKNLDVVKTFIFNHRDKSWLFNGVFPMPARAIGLLLAQGRDALVGNFVVSVYHIEGSGMT